MAIELRRTNALTTSHDRRELQAIHTEARKAAARINGAAYVTYVALQSAGVLTAIESELIGRAPLCEGRFRMMVDSFAINAAQEIAELRWRA
jgi:hypothetical protein